MGNCIMTESSTRWGGDDWGSLSPVPSDAVAKPMFSSGIGHDNKLYMTPMKMEERTSPGEEKRVTNSLPSSTIKGTEVKIKITKKQLEELLSKVDAQGQSVKVVLTQLLNLGDGYETHPKSWTPALQSIPEAELY